MAEMPEIPGRRQKYGTKSPVRRFMKTREQFVNNIILNIEEMCHNENIVNYVKRLLKENIDEWVEINDSYFRSKE